MTEVKGFLYLEMVILYCCLYIEERTDLKNRFSNYILFKFQEKNQRPRINTKYYTLILK